MVTNVDASSFIPRILFQTNFSVDLFLFQHRNSAGSLELLRDNIGVYLKYLRASMIDLINEDYSDFICLSGNLSNLNVELSNLNVEFSTIKVTNYILFLRNFFDSKHLMKVIQKLCIDWEVNCKQ